MKNVLEKILEEIEKEQNSYEADHAWNYSKGLEYAKEIIRSHIGEVNQLEKKPIWEIDIIHHESYDLGRNIGWNECLEAIQMNKDDNWILCSERLPEEHDSMFAKFKGTDKWDNAMFEKKSDEVNITYEFEDGTHKTGTSYTLDGKWKIEKGNGIVKRKVVAWKPLPEPYRAADSK